MSSERAQIIQVKSDVIQVALPYWEGAPETYLTASVAAGGTGLTVKSNVRCAQNDYVVFAPGEQLGEIKRITAAVTTGTALTVAAVTFAHGINTKLLLSRYDQVEIYGSSSASDAAPTLIGSAVDLDVRQGYTEIKASTTYDYYYCRYKNSNAGTYSSYSDSVAAGGLSAQARGEIKKEFLSIYNESFDDLITDDWLNRAINRWQRELQKRRKQWSMLRASTNLDTVQDQQGYTLPTDIQDNDSTDSIVSVKFYDKVMLKYIDQGIFSRSTVDHIGTTFASAVGLADITLTLTDASDFPSSGTVYTEGDSISYTGKSSNTLTGVTAITATHAAGKEVWSVHTTGQPQYYTVDNGSLKLTPIPDSAAAGKNVFLEYWKKFVDLADDADETLFLYPENCYLYLHWQSSIRRRLPDEIQLSRRTIWKDDLEGLVSEDPDFREIPIIPQGGNFYSNPY